VERQDHRARRGGREPTAERQWGAIRGDEGIGRERRIGGGCSGGARRCGGKIAGRGGDDTAGKKRGEAENDKTHGGSKEAPSLPRLWLRQGKSRPISTRARHTSRDFFVPIRTISRREPAPSRALRQSLAMRVPLDS
jgi:hypothetical protein